MFRIILGVFFVLHGLVHLLYLGQSQRVFELQPGMVWPDGSWLFAQFWDDGMVRGVTAVALIIAAVGFVISGIGLFWQQSWWRPILMGTAVFSSVLYLLLWDGGWQNLDDKGGVGVLINVALVTAVLLFRWPNITH
ncbi:MAG: hypothetical protein H6667_06090 [Ardenticatenaceae bacterium]|nr:hypothetical protein [Ardenticatenaceae bacterium]MCB9443762.1 hypothetical protein [Ardenticatenaceae bacterium]